MRWLAADSAEQCADHQNDEKNATDSNRKENLVTF